VTQGDETAEVESSVKSKTLENPTIVVKSPGAAAEPV
jgi:hypothetical protein